MKEEEEEPAKQIENFQSDIPKDFWEGDSWDVLGSLTSFAVPSKI